MLSLIWLVLAIILNKSSIGVVVLLTIGVISKQPALKLELLMLLCLNFRYITGSWSWVWGLFYFSFGPLLLLEIKIKALFVKSPKKSTDGGLTFIKACCSILGVGYVTVVSCTVIAFLFVPPVEDAGIKTAAVAIIEAHFGKQE